MNTPKKIYINTLLLISALVTVFHLLILVRLIPYEITWGGNLKTVEEMYVFETLSILINLFFVFILLQKGEYIRYVMGRKTVNIILWIFFVLFTLNTIGNLFAETNFEKYFTLLTLLSSVLIWLTQRTVAAPNPNSN
ncbi:MAG: hypothetical protein ACOVQJ_06130 [Bacteroidia bacterium]|jgi:hypothetical protein